jgi:hypothetical protein
MAEELRPVLQRAITRASGTRVDVALSPRPIGATSALALSEWQQGALAEDIVRSTHEGEAIDARIDSALCPPLSETGCDGLALLFGIACISPQDRGWIEFPDVHAWASESLHGTSFEHEVRHGPPASGRWYVLPPMSLHEAAFAGLEQAVAMSVSTIPDSNEHAQHACAKLRRSQFVH